MSTGNTASGPHAPDTATNTATYARTNTGTHTHRVVEVTDRITLSIVERSDQVDPTGHVTDQDLADQVRTALGPIVKALDLPRIHVMAEGLYVLLHGEVGTESDAIAIEDTVLNLPGVIGVESHLHVGLLRGDTRPSEGRSGPSEMMTALMHATDNTGIDGATAKAVAVRAALSVLFDQIPPGERQHVLGHLPADVVAFAKPRRHIGEARLHWRQPITVAVAIALRGGIKLDSAILLLPEVIKVIRTFVPEEDADIQATLSEHLREFWAAAKAPT
jgi:uncharacterized protein (DUF2267 family)